MDARPPVAGDEKPLNLLAALPAARSPLSARVSVFLFCDLRGYTDYTRENGAEAASVLVQRFSSLAAQVCTEYDGTSRGTWGDQVLLEFGSARVAVRASLALRERCLDATLADPLHPLWAGIGLDAGEAAGPDAMASGHALNVGARLCALATAGEVLASHEVVHLAGTVAGVRYAERHPVTLKGVPGRTSVVRLEPTRDDAARTAALHSLVARGTVRRRRGVVGVVAATVIALVAGSGWLLLRDPAGPALPTGGVAVLDGSGQVTAVAALGQSPAGATAGHHAVWVVKSQADVVARIDPVTRRVTETIPVGRSPGAVATDADDVWVANGADGTVSWVNATTNRVVLTIAVGSLPAGIAYGAGRVWVSNEEDGSLTVIDAATGAVRGTVTVGDGPVGVAFGAGRVWVANSRDNTVTSIDPATLQVQSTTPVGSGPRALAVSGGAVWVANSLDQTVTRIDPASRLGPRTVGVGDGPSSIAADGRWVWVGNAADGTVTRIDPRHNEATATVRLGASPTGLAVVGGAVWTPTRPFADTSHRGGTLTVADPNYGVDPQVDYGTALPLVYDTLVTVRRAAGAAYDLVPDLARTLPAPSDGGRTWTFQVRPGIRYSNGAVLAPEDFRRGMERLFTANGRVGPPGDFDVVTGAAGCRRTYPVCHLDRGITTTSGTVTFHLTRADPDFLHKLTMTFSAPVPAGTPGPKKNTSPVLGTGPYAFARFAGEGRFTLTRNPHFAQWSFAAKPDGYPDVIEYTGADVRDQAVHLDQITADVTDVRGSPLLPLLGTRYQDRLQHDPVLGTHYVALNTNAWPFNRLEARRALAFALDRTAVARYFHDTRVACQLSPPNFSGHEARCPFTSDPSESDDQWHSPDLARARALVLASPTRGAHVNVYVPDDAGGRHVGASLAATLSAIGYRPAVHTDGWDTYFTTVLDPRTPMQVSIGGWAIDYLTPSALYRPILSCDSATFNVSRRCSRSMDAVMNQALAAQNDDPATAHRLWGELNHRTTDDAAIVPVGYWDRDTFVSQRVGNYQDSTFWGPLYEQMWVR